VVILFIVVAGSAVRHESGVGQTNNMSNDYQNIPSPYEADFNTVKTLFMMEDAPMSGRYVEVMLTHEVANQLRDIVQKAYPTEGLGFRIATTDKDVLIPFARGEYDASEIKKALEEDGTQS
jgi:hypothetical protein